LNYELKTDDFVYVSNRYNECFWWIYIRIWT
jgi:hypothetical protein